MPDGDGSIERLDFSAQTAYNAIEASSHLARYLVARPFVRDRDVLDIACGQGYGAYIMRALWGARSVQAVDVSAEAIRQAERCFPDPQVRYVCQPAEELATPGTPQFDVVVSLETIEHVPDAEAFVRTLAALLRPDGTVIISCPNDYWYYPSEAERNPYHVRKFRLEEFRQITEGVLGPARQILLGTPISGFANVAASDPALRPDADAGMRGICQMRPDPAVLALLPDEIVDASNCSYFVGVWTPGPAEAQGSVLFPCSMTSSMRATQQASISNLQEEVRSLRTAVFNARQREAELIAARDRLRQRAGELESQSAKRAAATDEQRLRAEQAEREQRHAGLRTAAMQAENEYIREQAAETRRRLAEVESQREQQQQQAAALQAECDALRNQVEHLTRENTHKLSCIEEWGEYIKRIEADLAAAQRRIEHSPYFAARRLVGRLLGRRRPSAESP